jgi:hypothetical protein
MWASSLSSSSVCWQPSLLFLPVLLLIIQWTAKCHANVVKIAHLQPNNPAIQHEPQVLAMCSANLKERKILPDVISFE